MRDVKRISVVLLSLLVLALVVSGCASLQNTHAPESTAGERNAAAQPGYYGGTSGGGGTTQGQSADAVAVQQAPADGSVAPAQPPAPSAGNTASAQDQQD